MSQLILNQFQVKRIQQRTSSCRMKHLTYDIISYNPNYRNYPNLVRTKK